MENTAENYSEKQRGNNMLFQDKDRIVFAGDSVTDMESAQPVGEARFDNLGRSFVCC